VGCNSSINATSQKQNLVISDIAYDANKNLGYSVYIKENYNYIPYLVLTNNYNGNVLLLRKKLLDESQLFNDYSGYYPESIIDKYLNETFLATINIEIHKYIAKSIITIAAESSLGVCGLDTEQITRDIFLLSCTELGFDDQTIACVEGTPLEYFSEDATKMIACRQNEASSWWLRTSYTWYDCSAFGISANGTVGGGGVYYENGVRPAFCLLPNTPICEDYLDGEKIYRISE